VFVTVTDDENGSFGSEGSDTEGVNLGMNVTIAANPPIRVAKVKTIASAGILSLFFTAFRRCAFGLRDIAALLDITRPMLKMYHLNAAVHP
jgi:hypothetical protein